MDDWRFKILQDTTILEGRGRVMLGTLCGMAEPVTLPCAEREPSWVGAGGVVKNLAEEVKTRGINLWVEITNAFLLCRRWRGNNGFIWARKWLDIYPKTLEL